jgi:hypothetical protein
VSAVAGFDAGLIEDVRDGDDPKAATIPDVAKASGSATVIVMTCQNV